MKRKKGQSERQMKQERKGMKKRKILIIKNAKHQIKKQERHELGNTSTIKGQKI